LQLKKFPGVRPSNLAFREEAGTEVGESEEMRGKGRGKGRRKSGEMREEKGYKGGFVGGEIAPTSKSWIHHWV
jgi:hypothetical protein